jgi:hypothetical protein
VTLAVACHSCCLAMASLHRAIRRQQSRRRGQRPYSSTRRRTVERRISAPTTSLASHRTNNLNTTTTSSNSDPNTSGHTHHTISITASGILVLPSLPDLPELRTARTFHALRPLGVADIHAQTLGTADVVFVAVAASQLLVRDPAMAAFAAIEAELAHLGVGLACCRWGSVLRSCRWAEVLVNLLISDVFSACRSSLSW